MAFTRHPSIPEHLFSMCAERMECRDAECPDIAEMAPTGRFYITMGHCGFNSPANNRNGYATLTAARNASQKYAGARRG
jgi:hypothetical protein